ncbi:MAG: PAS domain S-box protein, partial [Desulfobacteraceae bacterium]
MAREFKKEEYERKIAELEEALTECKREIENPQEKRFALNEKGSIAGAMETCQDGTKRRQAEEALRNSERRLGVLLNFVPYPLVVFTLEGNVTYVNRGFTRIFGWTLDELEGKKIPYVPLGYEEEHKQRAKQLYEEKSLYRHESKRLTKDGRILDVAIRAILFYEEEDKPAGELVLFRDITKDKKLARINETLLRISMALPNYQELEDLLKYINEEVKMLLDIEGSVVVLVDEEKNDLYVPAAVYDKHATEQKIKKHHFSMDELLSGKVIRTGEPIIVSDLSDNRELHRKRDEKFGYQTRNMLIVPLKSRDK